MAFASISEILHSLGEGLTWAVNNLGAPILAGAVAGIAVPLVFRWESTGREVRQHNREITDLSEDFRRFMSDLDRQVERQHRQSLAEMYVQTAQDEIAEKRREDEGKPAPKSIVELDDPDLPTEIGRIQQRLAWSRRTQEAMFDALWQYRDEALRKRGKFIQIVEAETRRHARYRGRKDCGHPALRLSEDARTALESWRKRPNPFEVRPEYLLAGEDLTAMEFDLLPLETERGLTWEAATKAISRSGA